VRTFEDSKNKGRPMNRNIVTDEDVAAWQQKMLRSADTDDGYAVRDSHFEKLIKFIPSESVGLYLALDGLVRSAESEINSQIVWLWIVLGISLIFTWLYLKRVWRVERVSQIVVSMMALIAYVYAVGGPFKEFGFYRPWQSTAVLVITTAFLIFFEPPGVGTSRASASRAAS
jgi:hypothetical protein